MSKDEPERSADLTHPVLQRYELQRRLLYGIFGQTLAEREADQAAEALIINGTGDRSREPLGLLRAPKAEERE